MKKAAQKKPKAKRKAGTGLGIGTGTGVSVRKKAGAVAKTPKTPKKGKTIALKPVSTKVSTGDIVLTSLSVGVAGVLGYFGYQYVKKWIAKKAAAKDEARLNLPGQDTPPDTPPEKETKNTVTDNTTEDTTGTKRGGATHSGSTGFPLKKGSRGALVQKLQETLIARYGKATLPRYGADSDFGTETYNGLKKNGLPTVITESIFNVITGGGDGGATDASALTGIAEKLFHAAATRNISSVVNLLKNITGKDQYQQVSNSFMQYRLSGVRQTLVNGLLNSFNSEAQKQKIRFEFIRMGLQYNGDKWSLSGFGGKTIATTAAAIVWVNATRSMTVPANMVLGTQVARRLDYTLFENDKKYFLIKTQSIKLI
jgi:hypothetical protein